ncbi:MAG: sulfotransferase family protein [Terriglobia bacterium]
MLQSAATLGGSDDFGEPFFREGFDVLLRSLEEEAALHPPGAWRVCGFLIDLLVVRGRLTERLNARPQLAELPLSSPVFITGLPRTGTSFLHNLLGRIQGFRAFKAWELRAPVMPEGAGSEWVRHQIDQTAKELHGLYQYVPSLERIHKLEAEAPDECNWLFRNGFTTLAFSFLWHIPGYMRWETSAPRHSAYADYRRQLQILSDPDRVPSREPARLVLKDPCHLWHLDALLDTFEDAVIVQIHRDPAETVPSLASLCQALQSLDSNRLDTDGIGAYCVEMVDRGLEAMTRVRRERPDARIFDVHYRELIADPLGTLEHICKYVEQPLDEYRREAVSEWLEKHSSQPGDHRYRPEDFGLDAGALRKRYAEYIDHFNVQTG